VTEHIYLRLNTKALSTQAGVDFVQVQEVVYCCSDGSYSEVFLEIRQKIILSKPLKIKLGLPI